MPADRLIHPRAGKSHKVSMLTDLEYRVWTQYLLSADDFGVMRATPLAFQNDNDHLAGRPVRQLQRCIDSLVAAALVGVFTHQGKPYLYQRDWQTWQKVDYPRATLEPKPTAAALEACDEPTRRLFDLHPGGKGKKFRESSTSIPKAPLESSQGALEISPSNAGAHVREVASGYRQEAIGKGQEAVPEFPGDVWFEELKAAYPEKAVSSGMLTQQAFVNVLIRQGTPQQTFTAMLANLTTQKRGHQWRVKGMVPRLDKWLRDGLWEQVHEEAPVSQLVTDKTSRTLTSGAAFVAGGDRGPR